jgi:2,5-diketo-D-gluconate reductase A
MSEPPAVPLVELPGDARMPMVGLGTWKASADEAETAVSAALAAGYRHIDTATVYGNEAQVGSALGASGLDRAEVFITTKIPPRQAGHEDEVLRRSLRALRTDYVDLWLIHWPPMRSGTSRELWNAVRGLRDDGLVRAIGVSNYSLAQLDQLTDATGETPAVNQVRWSPSRYDPALAAGHQERGVVLEGYSPLRDSRLGDPVLTAIASAHQVTAAQVVLRWHLEHGVTVIPKSVRPERIAANIDLLGFRLSPDEVARVDALGKG